MEKQIQEENTTQQGSPKYWMTLDQWRKDPEFQRLAEQEFQSSPLSETQEGGWARREFLKLMGASMALSSFGCLRRPAQKIVPYVNRPEEMVLGHANYYSSSFLDSTGECFGLVVKTREGRPIKVEGNPAAPTNAFGLSARAQAHVLSLYDPDRLTGPQKVEAGSAQSTTYEELDADVSQALSSGKVALLTPTLLSPSSQALVDQFVQQKRAKHYIWDPMDVSVIRKAQGQCYGEEVMPRYRLDKAKYVVSIGADFLGTFLASTEMAKDFAKGRQLNKSMSRLVVFESNLSLTGSNADSRVRIKPSQQIDVVMGLLHEIIVKQKKSSYSNDNSITSLLTSYDSVAKALGVEEGLITQIAEDLWQNRGESLILAGGHEGQTQNALSLQVAVNFLNSVLGNDGKTIDARNVTYKGYKGSYSRLRDLSLALIAGDVDTVIVVDVNPVHSDFSAIKFKESLAKAKKVIYLGDRFNDTAKTAHWVVPTHHQMEDWGDWEPQTGVYYIQQPTIRPLYSTRGWQESLMKWTDQSGSWYDFVRGNWQNKIYSRNRSEKMARGSFEDFWYQLLQVGVFNITAQSRDSQHLARSFNSRKLSMVSGNHQAQGEFELVLYTTTGLADGTMANVSWLQEFPDPVTKICWDNYVSISPKVASAKHLSEGQIVSVKVGEQSVQVPVHIQPGLHDGVLALALGYGQASMGRVANGVGRNAYPLASLNENGVVFSGLAADLGSTVGKTQLACPQGHQTMEGRQIIVEATLEQYMKNPSANIHKHKVFSLWDKHEYKGRKWAMAVDLSLCNGCSACVVACQSENNIPVVGKEYVLQGRIMQWIRLDRYYVGTPEDPDVLFMPVMCQHCDNAPCETVCPVAATTHNDEGINEMIYNRCVGTRYCANNCPYKVRRFNWFDYTSNNAKSYQEKSTDMQMNPEVTVRSRGVMEKCSFCQPRIKQAQMLEKNEGQEIKDGDIQTACQQSCPTQAIVFGDMNDPKSRVSQMFQDQRTYSLLEELNAVPSVRYQIKVRNTSQLKGDSGHHGNHQEQGGHA